MKICGDFSHRAHSPDNSFRKNIYEILSRHHNFSAEQYFENLGRFRKQVQCRYHPNSHMLKLPYYSIEQQRREKTTTAYLSIRDSVLRTLEQELPRLRETYGIADIGIFGSVSRGEDTPDSDIDMLVSFTPQRETYDAYLGLAEDLEALFGRKVDLIFSDWIHPRMRPYILKDAIYCTAGDAA